MIDFQNFELPTSPNSYYVAPAEFSQIEPHKISPTYNMDVDSLLKFWQEMLIQQPRVKLLEQSGYQFSYVQRTKWLRFPDYIDVKLIAISDQQSTIAIFSRSKYGYSDFGVNKKRVMLWLALLSKQTQETPSKQRE